MIEFYRSFQIRKFEFNSTCMLLLKGKKKKNLIWSLQKRNQIYSFRVSVFLSTQLCIYPAVVWNPSFDIRNFIHNPIVTFSHISWSSYHTWELHYTVIGGSWEGGTHQSDELPPLNKPNGQRGTSVPQDRTCDAERIRPRSGSGGVCRRTDLMRWSVQGIDKSGKVF